MNYLLENYCRSVSALLPWVTIHFFGTKEFVYVQMSHTVLEMIMAHLLHNSIRYGGKVCCINVRIMCESGRVVVTVKDNGQGIRPEIQGRVFENGFYAPSNEDTEDADPGDGLGLWLVRQYLERLGGECTLQSTWGEGTTVRFSMAKALPDSLRLDSYFSEYLHNELSPVMVHFGALMYKFRLLKGESNNCHSPQKTIIFT